MRILVKTVKINLFRTSEINQRPATIRGMFIKEKQLNLGENRTRLSFPCSSPLPSPPAPPCWSRTSAPARHGPRVGKGARAEGSTHALRVGRPGSCAWSWSAGPVGMWRGGPRGAGPRPCASRSAGRDVGLYLEVNGKLPTLKLGEQLLRTHRPLRLQWGGEPGMQWVGLRSRNTLTFPEAVESRGAGTLRLIP